MKHETIEGSYYGFAASVHVALAMAISSQRVVALGESMVRRMRQSAPVSASSRPAADAGVSDAACTAPYRWLMASIASARPLSRRGSSPGVFRQINLRVVTS